VTACSASSTFFILTGHIKDLTLDRPEFCGPENAKITRRGVAIHAFIEIVFSGRFGMHAFK
jgi:hypothetical protein